MASVGSMHSEDSEFLWAGYSDLSEQLRQARAHNASLKAELDALSEAVQRLHRQHAEAAEKAARSGAGGPWQAASFLLLFLVVINIAGAIASFHLATTGFSFFGWGFGAKQAAGGITAFSRPMLGLITSAVPLANTAVVIVFCIQAIKAAWMCLSF